LTLTLTAAVSSNNGNGSDSRNGIINMERTKNVIGCRLGSNPLSPINDDGGHFGQAAKRLLRW